MKTSSLVSTDEARAAVWTGILGAAKHLGKRAPLPLRQREIVIDRNLADLFALYGASRGQVLWNLKLPSALPYILGGLRIAGGLSLIGAVVAEIAAGSAGAGSGLAYRIVESGYRLNIPRMFAALVLLSIAGIVIFYALAFVNHIALRRWHESALEAGS